MSTHQSRSAGTNSLAAVVAMTLSPPSITSTDSGWKWSSHVGAAAEPSRTRPGCRTMTVHLSQAGCH